MNEQEHSGGKFIYFIPVPPSIQAFLLVFSAFLMMIFFGVPLHQFGLAGTIRSFSSDLGVWLIMAAMFLPLLALFICLAYPPRSWLARLEFERECIRLVPKPPLRWIGEPTKEIPIDPSSNELILCAGNADGAPYGFRVIARGLNHRLQELNVASGARLTARQAKALSKGVAASIGVRLQLIQREFDDAGALREVPWAPSQGSDRLRSFGKVALAVSPFASGVAVAALRAGLPIAACAGFAIWLMQSAFLYFYTRASCEKRRFPTLLWLSTLITFSSLYMATYAVASYLLITK